MIFGGIRYDEPLFRPPSEAYSAILQITIGCSHNKCSFCDMYTSKTFKVRKFEDVKQDIAMLKSCYPNTRKVFLADGDPFVLSASKLKPILEEINSKFNNLQRISTYSTCKNVLAKSDDDLKQLRELGLKLLYIGIETGDDELLQYAHKGETSESIVLAMEKLAKAGIDVSAMIINGLGGRKYSRQHAENSAKIITQIKPKFLSTLTLSFPYGEEHFLSRFGGEYEQQTIVELMEELSLFIKNIEGDNIIFRCSHVSNDLRLEGILSKDKESLVSNISNYIQHIPKNLYPQKRSVL